MAAPDPERQPSTIPKLPLDIIYNIGLAVAANPLEQAKLYVKSEYNPRFKPNRSTLHRLTYLSRATKDVLEPLLYRHLTFTSPLEVMNAFINLIQRPDIRQHVQYIASFSPLSGPPVRKRDLPLCKKFWSRRCPSDKPAVMRLLDGAGLHKLAWSACMLERTKQRFMFSPDFKHDGILELMFAAILFMSPNVTTFTWRDMNTNPKAFILDRIMSETVEAGIPLMPKLQYLNTEKSAFVEAKQAQFFTPHVNMWDNLQTLHLNDIDLDVEFIEMLVKGDFKENRPVKELYIHCVAGAERSGSLSSFPPGFELSSTELLNPDDPEQDKEKFKAFPNLELLDIRFVYHQDRYENGSRTLKAFLHAIGAPKVLKLEGHRLPQSQLKTGITHDKLTYLKVREHGPDPGSVQCDSQTLITGLNQWWSNSSQLTPNLTRIDWDHYRFQREDLSGEDKAVWQMVGEEEWEDDSNHDSDDDSDSAMSAGHMMQHIYDDIYFDPDTGEYVADGFQHLMTAMQNINGPEGRELQEYLHDHFHTHHHPDHHHDHHHDHHDHDHHHHH